MPDLDRLTIAVQDALNHLDDRSALGNSELLSVLALQDAEDPATALQQTLVAAIRALQPVGLPDADAISQRRFQVLHGRYIEHLTQNVVASQVGLGTRQIRRVQTDAVVWLSRYLAIEFDLVGDHEPEAPFRRTSRPEAGTQGDINREMRWLLESSREQTADVVTAIRRGIELAAALAERRNVRLSVHCETPCPAAAIPDTVLRQILLNLISAMVTGLPEGSLVNVVALQAQDLARISVTASPAKPGSTCFHDFEAAGVEMSRRLARLFGGEVTLSEAEGTVLAVISLPTVQRMFTVIAIEDNQDTLRMWQRFLQQTAFQLIEAPDPTRALDLVIELQPDVVILDIMLGGIDGWDLLRQLREHPATCTTPIVVCSVLPQQPLAESLGAAGFIRKPVTGRDFRAALASQTVGAER